MTSADCQRLCAFPSGIPGQDRGREMRRKLKEREYAPEAVEETIYFLKEYHYLDNRSTPENMCGLPERERASRQLRQSLLSKGISREILDLCFEEETVDEEEAVRHF